VFALAANHARFVVATASAADPAVALSIHMLLHGRDEGLIVGRVCSDYLPMLFRLKLRLKFDV
jgi:hypothetical protein